MEYIRSLLYRGRHHWSPSDESPAGEVWFCDGLWWTFTRRHMGRVPRDFGRRSNPLDHEEVVVETWNECTERRRFAEVEY